MFYVFNLKGVVCLHYSGIPWQDPNKCGSLKGTDINYSRDSFTNTVCFIAHEQPLIQWKPINYDWQHISLDWIVNVHTTWVSMYQKSSPEECKLTQRPATTYLGNFSALTFGSWSAMFLIQKLNMPWRQATSSCACIFSCNCGFIRL